MSAPRLDSERCAWCNGTGGGPGGDCKVCRGSGFVTVPQPPMKCPRCWGNGRAVNGWVDTFPFCPACGGTGWINAPKKRRAAGA